MRQLTAARALLLTELAGLAAERRTAEDTVRLTQLISAIDATAEKPTPEWEIHAAIAYMAREKVLATVLRQLESLTALAPGHSTTRSSPPTHGYKLILQVIRSGLPQPARVEMAAHLTHTRATQPSR
jgi:DNA-binding FadR family transcriptional regulator